MTFQGHTFKTKKVDVSKVALISTERQEIRLSGGIQPTAKFCGSFLDIDLLCRIGVTVRPVHNPSRAYITLLSI